MQVFVYGRPLNRGIIYISQKYTKVATTIRENANYWILWSTSKRTLRENIYPELGDSFDSADEMYKYLNSTITTKFDDVVYNRESETWFSSFNSCPTDRDKSAKLNGSVGHEIKVKGHKKTSTGNKMKVNKMESRNYDIAKAKAYRAEQANVGLINSRKLFEQSLFAATADVFKPITQSVRDAGVT